VPARMVPLAIVLPNSNSQRGTRKRRLWRY
jgi:hypothetical protein